MAQGAQVISTAIDFAKKLKEKLEEKPQDDEFVDLRIRSGNLLKNLAEEPFNTALISQITDTISGFEKLNSGKISNINNNRRTVNEAVLSSRIRSTHYAAYIAGKYSADKNVGDKFKCWMHNIAAHSATEASVVLDGLISAVDADGSSLSSSQAAIAKIFKSSAEADAHRFLERARANDKDSVLTAYNTARLDLYSAHKERHFLGIDLLSKIPPPAEDCEAPEICWHRNNYESFEGDDKLKNILSVNYAQKMERIKSNIQINKERADSIAERREDIWRTEARSNKLAYSSFAVTLLTVGIFAYENYDTLNSGIEMSESIFGYLKSLLSENFANGNGPTGIFAAGDGGLAHNSQLARAAFGDGGLA